MLMVVMVKAERAELQEQSISRSRCIEQSPMAAVYSVDYRQVFKSLLLLKQQSNFCIGTNISHGDAKLPEPNAARPKPFASGKPVSSARIDQDEEADDDAEFSWETMPLTDGQDSTETIPWIISGSEAGVAKAEELVKAGLESAQKATHLAYLQVPRSFMPRIVGRGGSVSLHLP